MKEINFINRNSKYYVIWTTSIIQVKNVVITNHENIFFYSDL